MAMSRKHYQILAAAIRQATAHFAREPRNVEMRSEDYDVGVRHALVVVRREIEAALAADNPRFDAAKFAEAAALPTNN